MLFELAHWVLLGGTIYLALDLIPKGPLTWKLLSKYSLQSQVAIQIILVVGIALLIVQLAIFLLGLFYFIVEDSPVTFGSNGPVLLGILLIPIVSQLFRINVLVNEENFSPYSNPRDYRNRPVFSLFQSFFCLKQPFCRRILWKYFFSALRMQRMFVFHRIGRHSNLEKA